jgi:molybdopterin converting factor small subunit
MTTHIDIRLFATLRKFSPQSREDYIVEDGATVGDILKQLQIPAEKVKLIFINSAKASLASVVEDGDRVGIFPPVGGG